ncbi:MAG: penicillin-binding protein 2 [Chloroflexi bacterium]|nr:penicillin-binding protein 2 [Chloroflexota bacterium]
MPDIFDPLKSMSRSEHDAHDRLQRQLARRLLGFRVVILVAFAVLGVKLWDMQIVHSGGYIDKAVENRVRERTVKALRGVIYDRNRKQLVYNRPSFDIAVDVEDLPSADEPRVMTLLGKLLNANAAELTAKIDQQRSTSPTIPVTVASSVDWPIVLQVKEDHVELPGVLPVQSTIRDYVDGSLLSGIAGYVGPITQEEFPTLKDEGYEQDAKIGRAGVELTYEDDLRGANGLQHVEVDAGGREVQVLDEVPAKPGTSLQLTIDSDLQKDVTSYLRWGLDRAHCYEANPDEKSWTALCPADVKAQVAKPPVDGGHGDEGAAIVMDVHTGEILALAAFPQYDNNVFSGRAIDQPKAADVLTRHDNPLINRALSAYAPGSTFKQITASAALQERVVTPTSGISVGACWATIRFCNWEPRGYSNMNVVDAIAQSNDIWMATVVAGNGFIRGIGPDKLAWYAQQFGIGLQSGVDLPFEQKGLAPTTAWKAGTYTGDDSKWYEGDSLNVAIGQGFDLATPLQMLNVAATVANGGSRLVPHVAKAILDSQGNVVRSIAPQVKEQVPVEPQLLESVRQGMRKGVVQGSSVVVNLHELKTAGKTGTAEFVTIGPNGQPLRDKNGNLPENAWWVGFAPYDNPQIAVAVFVHDAGEGAAFAAPVAQKIFARYFHVSDLRNPWGCDTLQSTPSYCAGYPGWVAARTVYDDPITRESKDEDFHDPSFPWPKDTPLPSASAAPPSAAAKPR